MNLQIVGGLVLIVLGIVGLLMLTPGFTATLEGLLGRQIPTDKWTRGTRVAIGLGSSALIVIGVIVDVVPPVEQIITNRPTPGPSTPTILGLPPATLSIIPPTFTAIPTTLIPPTFNPNEAATTVPIPTVATTWTPTPYLGIGSTRISTIDGATMVYVPAGDFTMGSSEAQVNDAIAQLKKDCGGCDPSFINAVNTEKPQHTAYLDAFWMDQFEVTNVLYKKCVDAGKCSAPAETKSVTRSSYYGNSKYDNYPVIYVSWNDARAYCQWAGKRLPTEAEWEKAARGMDGRFFPWGNTFDQNLLNSFDGGKGDTTAVGSYPRGASSYGVMDMAGNVGEWVADWYDANYYVNSPRNNPMGPISGTNKVLRGGGFSFSQGFVRAAYRYTYDSPAYHYSDVGVRCAQ